MQRICCGGKSHLMIRGKRSTMPKVETHWNLQSFLRNRGDHSREDNSSFYFLSFLSFSLSLSFLVRRLGFFTLEPDIGAAFYHSKSKIPDSVLARDSGVFHGLAAINFLTLLVWVYSVLHILYQIYFFPADIALPPLWGLPGHLVVLFIHTNGYY